MITVILCGKLAKCDDNGKNQTVETTTIETQISDQPENQAAKNISKKHVSYEDDDDDYDEYDYDSDESSAEPISLNLLKLRDTIDEEVNGLSQQVDIRAILDFIQGLVDEQRQSLKQQQQDNSLNSKRQISRLPHFRLSQPQLASIDSKHDILCFHRQYGVKLNKLLLAKNCPPRRQRIRFQIQSAKTPGKMSHTNSVQVDSGTPFGNLMPIIPTTSTAAKSGATQQLFKEMAKTLRAKAMKKKFEKFALL